MAEVVSPTDRVHGVFAALDAKDPTAVTAQMTDDVRTRLGNADTVEGKASFLEATEAFVASIEAIRHEIASMWTVDDVVIAEMDVHYERHDGRKVTLPCCNVFPVRDGLVSSFELPVMGTFEISDGKINAWRDYFDVNQFTSRMG